MFIIKGKKGDEGIWGSMKELSELRKIPLDNEFWTQSEPAYTGPSVCDLLRQFEACPDTGRDSEVFAELCERICESNTIYPVFYLVFPYLVDLVVRQPAEQAKELWEWMGAWLSEGYQAYASRMPREVMDVYQESLILAERAVLDFISQYDFASCRDSVGYLLGAPFAFVNPEFGVLSTMHDMEIWLETSCPGGHTSLCTVQRRGITDSSERSVFHSEVCWRELRGRLDRMPVRSPNPWDSLLPLPARAEEGEKKQIAAAVCQKGISGDSPRSAAVFLYSYLLESLSPCEEEVQFARVCYRLLDKISCPECGVSYTVIDGWKNFG